MKEYEDYEEIEAVELPIDGILDLHTFNPRDVKDLLPEYLTACRRKGILEVRIIHGKGIGMLRETVHSMLKRIPDVISFRMAGQDAGSWGATLVRLRPADQANEGKKRL
jgi:DNA-nicking Smr family endonuclease